VLPAVDLHALAIYGQRLLAPLPLRGPPAPPVQYTTVTLSRTQRTDGLSVVTPLPNSSERDSLPPSHTVAAPASIDAALCTASDSPYPPPFSSLYFPSRATEEQRSKPSDAQDDSPPAFAAAPPFTESSSSAAATAVAETKAALPRDTKDGSRSKDLDDGEPPPPYSEGYSPLESFTYVMASAGGPASIITQVSQSSAGPPLNTLGGGSDENITLELRYVTAAQRNKGSDADTT
jgi:ATP-binding cassette subfamily F protein 3